MNLRCVGYAFLLGSYVHERTYRNVSPKFWCLYPRSSDSHCLVRLNSRRNLRDAMYGSTGPLNSPNHNRWINDNIASDGSTELRRTSYGGKNALVLPQGYNVSLSYYTRAGSKLTRHA